MSDTPRTDAADLYDYQTAIEVCGQLERELAVARKGLEAVESLMNESHGVGGLHLNGDFAPWSELRTGGRFEEWLIAFDDALNAARSSNAPRQPRRDSGVGLDAVVGLLPVGLIPIPPIIIQEANRRAMENGDLTFGHGFALGLALCASWGLCAAAIWIKRAIVRRFRKANTAIAERG